MDHEKYYWRAIKSCWSFSTHGSQQLSIQLKLPSDRIELLKLSIFLSLKFAHIHTNIYANLWLKCADYCATLLLPPSHFLPDPHSRDPKAFSTETSAYESVWFNFWSSATWRHGLTNKELYWYPTQILKIKQKCVLLLLIFIKWLFFGWSQGKRYKLKRNQQ